MDAMPLNNNIFFQNRIPNRPFLFQIFTNVKLIGEFLEKRAQISLLFRERALTP